MSNDDSAAVAGDRTDEPTADADTDGRSTGTDGSAEGAGTRVDALAAENHRIRAAYADAKSSQYRFTAVALVTVGVVALLAALAFPSVREVLLAVGGTGVVLGILSVYLAPSPDRPQTLDAALYGTLATNQRDLCDALESSDERVYVPVDDRRVRLFVPRDGVGDGPTAANLPSDAALRETVVGGPDSPRGAAFDPTGASLVTELEASDGELVGVPPERAADRLVDALGGRFRLVQRADATVDAEAGEARITVDGNALAPIDGFDHPVASVLGVGLARALDRPVTVAVESDDEGGAVVTCRWATDEQETVDEGSDR